MKEWDSARTERVRSLDRVLESLGDQVVPPNLHQMGTGSSLFGSHHSSLHGRPSGEGTISPNDPLQAGPTDRASWKTLRDFVDERAIEEAMERMEQERAEMIAEVEAQIERALASMAVDMDDSDYGGSRPSSRLSSRSAPSALHLSGSRPRPLRSFSTESTLTDL